MPDKLIPAIEHFKEVLGALAPLCTDSVRDFLVAFFGAVVLVVTTISEKIEHVLNGQMRFSTLFWLVCRVFVLAMLVGLLASWICDLFNMESSIRGVTIAVSAVSSEKLRPLIEAWAITQARRFSGENGPQQNQ